MTAGGKYIEGDRRHIGDCSNQETNTLENRVNFGTATNRRPSPVLGKTTRTLPARRFLSQTPDRGAGNPV
jgi:hypothetical protein